MGNITKLSSTNKKQKVKIGLAFGGGGSKGIAHLGALKAFEENGLVFDEVAGTSVGSIIASLYAFGLTSDQMMQKARTLKEKDIRNSKLFFRPSSTEGIENLMKSLIGDAHFEDMKKPLTVVAVDIKSGKEINITKGSVVKAVAGSCAVPGIFNTVDFGEFRLVDGGLQNNIPADVLRRNGCKFVVSIDVNPTRGYGTDSTKILDVLEATLRILMKSNSIRGKVYSDVVIEANTSKFKSTSLVGIEEMFYAGYHAAMSVMPKIKELFKMRDKREFNFLKIFKRNKKEILNSDSEILQR